jgi:hypothetical protein
MNRSEDRWAGGRRRAPGVKRRFSLWPPAVLSLLAGIAMVLVWQHVQFTRVSLRHGLEKERERKLVSDLGAYRLRMEQRATLSELDPAARERLGLTDIHPDDMRLVAFDEKGLGAPGGPGLIDQIVPPAVAGDLKRP